MYNTVPRTAKSLCLSPSKHSIAIPVKINPSCDMLEHANTRLIFTAKTASNAPNSIVIKAKLNKNIPQLKLLINIFELITIIPNIPALVNKPDNNALAGAGAAV